MSKAVVVFSGGQDSTTVLGHALNLGFECHAIGFNYGQKHKVELEQAQIIADKLKVPFHIVDVRAFGALVGSKSGLLDHTLDVTTQSPLSHMPAGIPASFVPNRNAMFLTMAHAHAQILGANTVWTGVCQTDFSGYPDCRLEFVEALENALNIGYKTDIKIMTPLMHLTKAQTFKMAEEDGVLDQVIFDSHTCYHGVRSATVDSDGDSMAHDSDVHFHPWGHGCGECPACLLRAKGWEEYQAMTRIG